jgi:azurin
VDVFGGFTAAAGHSLYTARQYPSSFWNKTAFVTEPTGRLIHTVNLQQSGAGFKEIGDGRNLFASADEWCAPIQAEVGPDGNVWVTDWYDFIIQHNPTPKGYETGKGNAHINPLRDHERGRIYRIVYKNAAPAKTMSLNKNDKVGLVAALSSNNMFWRTTAQRLLVESGDQSIAAKLYPLIRNQQLDAAGINAPAIHALWTLHGLGLINSSHPVAMQVAEKALSHVSAGVRRAAVAVLQTSANALPAYQKARVLDDKDLRVRLAAVIAIADSKPSAEGRAALLAMNQKKENQQDHWISKALNAAIGIQAAAPKTDAISNSTKADQVVNLSVVKEQMKYSMQQFTVKAGTIVRLTLTNPDFMQHNLLILQPASMERVGAAADKLATEKNGAALQYIPKMSQVLFSMPLVNPQKSFTITFKVPAITGDYPYICTFPGHWRLMNGIMKVVAK